MAKFSVKQPEQKQAVLTKGVGQGVERRGAILEIELERGALKPNKGLEHRTIFELAGAQSAKCKMWVQDQKGPKR